MTFDSKPAKPQTVDGTGHQAPPPDLFPRLEPLLERVQGPAAYLGGEVNSQTKPWNLGEGPTVRWCLAFPDAYEVGLPNQGLAILYEVLNARPDTLAERTYTPRQDMERAMRQGGVPLFTWDAHRPVRSFDILGVSLSTELGYTNLLTMLDLAGVPLRATERGSDDPLVIVGGHCATNPEPLASFIDGAVLGDGEVAVGLISDLVAAWKRTGQPGGRAGLLDALARRGGVYVPALFDVTYDAGTHLIAAVTPVADGLGAVAKHTVADLDTWPLPQAPLLPWVETVHERVSTEIFRGCTRGCRFCQAGMITRPVRERSVGAVVAQACDMLANTGFDEVSLLSLSSADHSQIGQLATTMADRFEEDKIGLSLPSTRIDAFDLTLARQLQRGGRRSGLTFAPEGGSARMRRVINKQVTEDNLIQTVTTAFEQGWRAVKLYFMCGLPTEQENDVVQIAHLAGAVVRAGRAVTGRRDVSCTCSIGPFVPKPHTPFQWAEQCPAEVVDHRLRILREAVAADRSTAKAIKVRWAAPRPAILEGLLARGDRRVGAVIEQAWLAGARFDGWRESLDLDLWDAAARQVLEPQGLSVDWFTTRPRDFDEVLPWDHLDVGLDRYWLWDQWEAAAQAEGVEDCRWSGCYDCGVCTTLGTATQLAADLPPIASRVTPSSMGSNATSENANQEPAQRHTRTESSRASGAGDGERHTRTESTAGMKLAVEYAKQGRLRFASPRVLQRVFERAVRRAGIPVAYSQGFTPHPRLSYLQAAPTGAQSHSEYLIIRLAAPMAPDQLAADLDHVMPAGLSIKRAVALDGVDLANRLEASRWRIELPGVDQAAAEHAAGVLMARDGAVITRPPRGDKPAVQRDVRPALVYLAGPSDALPAGLPAETQPSHPELAALASSVTPSRMELDATSGNALPDPAQRHTRLEGGAANETEGSMAGYRQPRNSQISHSPGEVTDQDHGCGILEAVIRHGTPAVRPDDVIAALTESAGLAMDKPAVFVRLTQGLLRGNAGSIQDPLSRP